MESPENLAESEFAALRETIRSRGTVRIVLAAVTFFCWVTITVVLLLFSELPIAALLSLAVLAAGFEAMHALHVGVERIGRYLQVFYEERIAADGVALAPRWETIAMQSGPALPGGGVDPLFTVAFLCAAIVNMIPALLPSPTPIEAGAVAVMHLAFVVRIVRARIAAGKQRATDLARFRGLQKEAANYRLPTPNKSS